MNPESFANGLSHKHSLFTWQRSFQMNLVSCLTGTRRSPKIRRGYLGNWGIFKINGDHNVSPWAFIWGDGSIILRVKSKINA